jgi:hypothetical protein
VRVAANWLTMVQSRQSLLEKAMLLALGSARQVTLEASSDQPPANPAAARPPASPVPATVAVVPQQSETLQPLAAVAVQAVAAKSENQSPVEAKRQQPPSGPAISALQAPAAPILGRLETSTKLLADFFQGEVIESSEIDAVETPGEDGPYPEAQMGTIQFS